MINKSDLSKFNPDVYTKITLNDLVVYSIHYLHNNNIEVTSEDIISACFMLFPKKFSLRKHPHWPDSAMVSRHWGVCRSKGYIAAGTDPEFKLTAKGVKLAKKVAKGLGMAISKQAAKVPPSRPKIRAVTPPRKVQSVVRAEKIISSASTKKTQSPRSKERAVTRAKKAQLAQKEKVVLQPAVRKEQSVRPATPAQAGGAKEARPAAPIKSARPKWTKKTKPPEPMVRSVKVGKAQLTTIHAAQSNMTQEVKVRAGKFVRAMETSDAYIHYKKNGKSSKITEFDFRSLLLCTMESSPETLARNVEQFKGYARIHNRQDLVAFLNFCAAKLSYLLVPQTKRSTKPTRRTMK